MKPIETTRLQRDRARAGRTCACGSLLLSLLPMLALLPALPLHAQIEWTPEAQVNWDDLYDDWMPMVAAGPDGRVWVVWQQSGPRGWEVFASVWEGSGWSYQQAVCPDDGIQESLADIAVGPDCMPWVVMERRTGGPPYLHTSRWNSSGWDPPEPLFPDMPDEREPLAPRIAVDSEGTPWVIWSSYVNEAYDSDLFYSRRVGGVWSPPEPVCPNSGPGVVNSRDLSTNESGDLWVMWGRTLPPPNWGRMTLASHWTETAWAEPDTVTTACSARGIAAGSRASAWVAGSVDGDIWVWQFHGGEWLPSEQVSAGDARYDGTARIATDSDGAPWVAWPGRFQSGSVDFEEQVYANQRGCGQWSDEQQVSSLDAFGVNWSVNWVDIAVGRDARAWVVWDAWDGSDYEIRYSWASGPDAAPSSSASSVSGAVHWYPNPAKDWVCFQVPGDQRSRPRLHVYDTAGRLVREVSSGASGESFASACPRLIWDCTDLRGERVSQGSYVYHVESEGRRYEGVLILLK